MFRFTYRYIYFEKYMKMIFPYLPVKPSIQDCVLLLQYLMPTAHEFVTRDTTIIENMFLGYQEHMLIASASKSQSSTTKGNPLGSRKQFSHPFCWPSATGKYHSFMVQHAGFVQFDSIGKDMLSFLSTSQGPYMGHNI